MPARTSPTLGVGVGSAEAPCAAGFEAGQVKESDTEAPLPSLSQRHRVDWTWLHLFGPQLIGSPLAHV